MSKSLNKIINTITEQAQALAAPVAPQTTPVAPIDPVASIVKPQATVVLFDKGQAGEFKVKFSERGFLIDGTRLSFESVEDAISKKYNIHLNGGQGIVLDAVRMQKILKYKSRV
jgi:hypothetical protein|tara:strand:- start:22218 stop:22559 length:342 start_codon:yes stop_codon:yes gene_type:complete